MRDGYVYVVQAIKLGWVKIGWAKDIARRMCEVAPMCGSDLTLLGCFAGTQRQESETMRRFKADQIALDWFIPSRAILAFARELPSPIQISFVGTPQPKTRWLRGRLLNASSGRTGPHQHLASSG